MPTLVISPRFSADSQYLWRTAIQEGWDVHRATRYDPPDDWSDACCYGELLFCDSIARRMELALLDPPDDFLTRLPYEYRKRWVHLTHLYDIHRERERAFFKPPNDKVFPAQVYESGLDIPSKHLDLTCPVLVSEIVSFDAEVRCHVLDRQVVTAATYHKAAGLRVDTTKGGAAWLKYILDDPAIELPSAVVVDVGLIPGRGWAVIEANQAYASGVYDEAEGKAVLPLLLRSAGPRVKVSPEDVPYIRMID